MKILLVEDDIMLNEMITEYLSSTGHAITSAKSGDESLKILNEQRFDLLILDINLPDIDGFTILENMHEQKRRSLLLGLALTATLGASPLVRHSSIR